MFDIQEELKKLPAKPGVYIMHDAHDDIIYVGKAVVLKNRVRQYFQNNRSHTPKIRSMVSHVARFEYIVTDSELEALVLECNLIKEHRPKYNTMLKDDKTYPYIKITTGELYPRIFLSRNKARDKARYFGPYSSAQSVRETIELVQKVCRIRTCRRKLPEQIGKERPCLYYHMGQCQAPCREGGISSEEYQENVREAVHLLSGNFGPLIDELTGKMQEAAGRMDFEKAAWYRDQIISVKQIDQRQKITENEEEDRDVIAFARQRDEAVVQVFFFRKGKIVGREHFYLTGVGSDEGGEVLQAFIQQYYAGAPFIPRTLMIQYELPDRELIEQWLTGVKGRQVRIVVPVRGQKERMVELAAENARMVLEKDREKIRLEQARTTGAVKTLAEMLDIAGGIHRMEAYDISNISGVDSVGSMIVFEDGRPRRNAYRKFRIRTVQGPDDYASMEEVLTRRFQHGLLDRQKEGNVLEGEEGGFARFPDVLMMDGGRGQVNAALAVLDRFGLDIPVCGMVKDSHHRTRGLYYHNTVLPIDSRSELFKLITRMQDEAHRFAIEYHRSLHGHGQVKSVLDDIPGIGPARRRALMRCFGSIENIRAAKIEELEMADSMTAASARAVYEYFHRLPADSAD